MVVNQLEKDCCRVSLDLNSAEAEKIRLEAEEHAAATREGADHYAESVLTRIDTDLQNLGQRLVESQTIVRNGQRLLGQVKRHPTAPVLNAAAAVSGLSSPLLGGRPDQPQP